MIKNRPPWPFLVAAAVALAGCGNREQLPPGYQGVVEYEERVVAFEVPGRVVSVSKKRGDVVEPGDELARLDDTLERLTREVRADEVAAARANLALLQAGARKEDTAAAAARVRAVKASEELLEKTLARTRSLHDAGSASDAELDRVEAERSRVRAERQSAAQQHAALRSGARPEELERAKARVETAMSALALSDERLARYGLRATVPGTVLDVHVEPGELAGVGTPAMTIADTTHPFAEVFVPEGELAGIQVGATARLRVDAQREPLAAVVEHVATRTEFTPRFLFSERERPNLVIRVRVRIEDPERRLHAGVPAFAQIER